MRTLIHARYVLGFDGSDHVIVDGGQVVYEEDRIIYVGAAWDGRVDRTMDMGNALVTPGLIDLDALADIDHALLDSWVGDDRAAGLNWSQTYFQSGRRDVFSLDERIFIREFALVQLLLHGVTTCMPIASEVHSSWAETADEMIGMAQVAQRLGIRAYLGPSYRAGVNAVGDDGSAVVLWDTREGDEGLRGAASFARSMSSGPGDLVHAALLPSRIETLTVELMESTARLAAELGVLVRLHCLQGVGELKQVWHTHGTRPIALLKRAGLLGPGLLIPHGIYAGGWPRDPAQLKQELGELADAGVSVIHCPLTAVRYGMVLDSFDRYRSAGINLALGTDSFPPDLVRGMDYGNNLAKVIDRDLAAGTAANYFRAATTGGATALGRDDLGRLAPGARADIVAFSFADPRIGVTDDPIRTLLMNCNGRDAALVVVAGRTVMRDAQLPGVDLVAMRHRAQGLFDRMRRAYTERDYLSRSPDELFPSSFPVSANPIDVRSHRDGA